MTTLVTGLLFFNLGVEVGQVLFAILVVMGILLLKRAARSPANVDRMERGLHTVMGYGAGCLAAFWVIERVAAFVVTVPGY